MSQETENVEVNDELPEEVTEGKVDEKDSLIAQLRAEKAELIKETKGRKEKLRKFEREQEEKETAILEEKEEWKEAYQKLKERTKDYDDLVAFKDSFEETQKSTLEEKIKLLSESERQELEFLSDLSLAKKLIWIDSKIAKRSTPKLPTEMSVVGGGGMQYAEIKTRSQLMSLGMKKITEFKSKFPDAYHRAMKNNK